MCTAGMRLPLAEQVPGRAAQHSPPLLLPACYHFKVPNATRKTTIITTELAVYTLEMASFDGGDLDTLTQELFSTRLNLSPTLFCRNTVAVSGLCATHDEYNGIEKNKLGAVFSPLYQNVCV